MNIFDATRFVCRGECGQWGPFWQSLYICSNVGIALCYLLIGVSIAILGRRTRNGQVGLLIDISATSKARGVALWLVAVFWLCMGGHVVENVCAFWWPAYRFFAVWHFVTFCVSAIAAYKLGNWGLKVIKR